MYRFEEATDNKGVTLEGGMKLYGLEHFELMHERVLDTKALMAWNHNTVVLSFRGTASFKNVLAGKLPCCLGLHSCACQEVPLLDT